MSEECIFSHVKGICISLSVGWLSVVIFHLLYCLPFSLLTSFSSLYMKEISPLSGLWIANIFPNLPFVLWISLLCFILFYFYRPKVFTSLPPQWTCWFSQPATLQWLSSSQGWREERPPPREPHRWFNGFFFFTNKHFSMCYLYLVNFQSPEMIGFDSFVQFNIIFGWEDLPASSSGRNWKSY